MNFELFRRTGEDGEVTLEMYEKGNYFQPLLAVCELKVRADDGMLCGQVEICSGSVERLGAISNAFRALNIA